MRNAPLVVLTSLLGSFAIYCTSAVINGTSPSSGGVPDAKADPGMGPCCGATAPQYVKIADGSLTATVAITDESASADATSVDIDVSSFRQVSLLTSYSGTCAGGDARAYFRFEPSSADQAGAGAGVLGGGGAFTVPAPVMRVVGSIYKRERAGCSGLVHYTVVGIK